jgi:hypothetical protein
LKTYRFVIQVNNKLQNFLKIKETKSGDLIISERGRAHNATPGTEAAEVRNIDERNTYPRNITVHPNRKSDFGTITINYKKTIDNGEEKEVAGVFNVKNGTRLFPILTSIGRNVGRPRLAIDENIRDESEIIKIWPDSNLDLKKHSLAYCIFVCNPNIEFLIPDEVPRKYISIKFNFLQMIFVYWLFNQPTKFRGLTITFPTPDGYVNGLELHEAINYTIESTLKYLEVYPSLPEI